MHVGYYDPELTGPPGLFKSPLWALLLPVFKCTVEKKKTPSFCVQTIRSFTSRANDDVDDPVLWLCVQDFERSRAFSFLNEVKKRFQTTYGSRAQTALPYAMNSEFSSTLAAQMVRDISHNISTPLSNASFLSCLHNTESILWFHQILIRTPGVWML